MRTKRKQRRQQKLPTPPPEVKGLPDPFSALNGDIVEQEVNEADMCPCCVDRQQEILLNQEEDAYLKWLGKE